MVWNIGDPAADGATDLLFTLAVAATTHLGVSHAAARLRRAAHLPPFLCSSFRAALARW